MTFRRLTVPAYTGGLPGGYAYINNAISGTPAQVNTARVGGPDDGTFFLGLAEDASSANFNRGPGALAENTDYLDDLLRRDLAIPIRHTANNLTLPVGTYLGPSGHPDSVPGYAALFMVVGGSSLEEARVNGQPCRVTAVALGGGDAIGSGGYSANTLELTVTPAPSNYFVIYYGRGNLATHSNQAHMLAGLRAQVSAASYLTSSLYAAPDYVEGVGTGTNEITLPASSAVNVNTQDATSLDLVTVTDLNNQAIIDSTDGSPVRVTAIQAGAASLRGYSSGSRTLTLSGNIGVGVNYRIHLGISRELLNYGISNTDMLVLHNRLLRILNSKPSRENEEVIRNNWTFSGVNTVCTDGVFSTDGTQVEFLSGPGVTFGGPAFVAINDVADFRVNDTLMRFLGTAALRFIDTTSVSIADTKVLTWAALTGTASMVFDASMALDVYGTYTQKNGSLTFESSAQLKIGVTASSFTYATPVTVTRRPVYAIKVDNTVVPIDDWALPLYVFPSDSAWIPISFPHGVTNITFTLTIDPGSVIDPGTKLAVRLRRKSTAGVVTSIATVTDTTAGAGYYVSHPFVASFTHTYDATYAYALEIIGETGAGGTNTLIERVSMSYDVGSIHPVGV